MTKVEIITTTTFNINNEFLNNINECLVRQTGKEFIKITENDIINKMNDIHNEKLDTVMYFDYLQETATIGTFIDNYVTACKVYDKDFERHKTIEITRV